MTFASEAYLVRSLIILAFFAPIAAAQSVADLMPSTSLTGTVADSNGGPLQGVTLTLHLEGGAGEDSGTRRTTNPSILSDEKGKFAFASIDPGRYRLVGEKNGFLRQAYGGKPGSVTGTILNLLAGQPLQDVGIVLLPMGWISGRVLDENGRPVVSMLELFRKGYSEGRPGFILTTSRGNSRPDGSFSILDVPPGQYYLRVRAGSASRGDSEGPVSTFYGGTTDVNQAVALQVSPGSALTGIEIRLATKPFVRARGHVVGVPVRQVMLVPRNGVQASTGALASVAQDGSFEFGGVAPGEYRLMAGTGDRGIGGSQDLNIGVGGEDNAVLRTQFKFGISGRVVFADQSPPPSYTPAGISIRLFSAALNARVSTIVGSDGSFMLEGLTNTKYQVNISAVPTGSYLAEVKMGRQDVLNNGLDLSSSGQDGTVEVILKSSPGGISGTVTAEDGNLQQQAIVTLIPDSQPAPQSLYRRTRTDQNGQFVLQDLPRANTVCTLGTISMRERSSTAS